MDQRDRYFLFLDESGDHGLITVDPSFPVFILCGVLIHENDYYKIRDAINELKNKLWGNKLVVFHSSDIRKCNKEFQILFDLEVKKEFYESLNNIIKQSDYTVFASAINKEEYIARYGKLGNSVYEISLSFIIERTVFYLDDTPTNNNVQIVIERRGKKEDKKLTEHWQKLMARGTGYISPERLKYLGLKLNFRSKSQNVNGLQLADLIAYPIARFVIDSKRANPAYDLIKGKIYNKGDKNFGLKIFP
ncbi:DUF3800 domain-containing protein [Mucilaginibacter sp. L196]|uniref:DUF3800 domain-containing protein n=1 Tax=Mucilaginibacter sp. L196 TaxID=1641870 RepID=UPI00131E14B3|nr:DUF3800 domain-containing protein [Mucilaginibacter sp. L196]